MSRLTRRGHPDSAAIRAGHANIRFHLEYLSWLMERRNWLAGDRLTLADISAAAHFSCIDYLGDVPWDTYEDAKTGMRASSPAPACAPSSPTPSPACRPSRPTPTSISEPAESADAVRTRTYRLTIHRMNC